MTVTLLKRLTLQSDALAIRVGKYSSRKIIRSLEGRCPAQSLSLRQCDCGGEAPSREALIVIEPDISLRHVQEDYTSCHVMAIERPKIHLGIRLWRKSERQNSDLMDGNIKEEERKVSTAKSEEKKDWNLKRERKVLKGRVVPAHAVKAHGGLEVLLHSFLTSALAGSAWRASLSDRFTPGVWIPGTYCIRSREGQRSDLEALEKR